MLLAAGCQRPMPSEPATETQPEFAVPEGAERWEVVPGESQAIIRVYRAGRLANLGHNHVISTTAISGRAWWAPELAESRFELSLPVAEFEVDDPVLRADAGADFPGELPPDAIDGTRANMLGDRQLDAANWPEVRVIGDAINGELPDLSVDLTLLVRGQASTVTVPVRLVENAGRLLASGEFTVAQTKLGMEPFSVMLGALQVRDELDISFSLTLSRTEAP